MPNPNEPPLDEIQWRSPQALANMGGIHSNTILFYFAESPFFERTSNNNVIMSQAMNNMQMYHFIQTREAFEGRLREMSGLEFIVGEEPAETGPGMGTGVWVIRKQTRRKRYQSGEEDEIMIHSSYFVVGENIYMAPTLADILASRIMTISSAISKALPAAQNARKWRPSLGHVYQLPSNQPQAPKSKIQESKESTPMPESLQKAAGAIATPASKTEETSMERVAEESLMVHMKYGGDYIDENPILGRPGEFHFTGTGRKPAMAPQLSQAGIGTMNGPTSINTKVDEKKDGKEKVPKSATKVKRKKSRIGKGGATPSATTPAATTPSG